MKAEDIKDSIQISRQSIGDNTILFTGTLKIEVSMLFDKREIESCRDQDKVIESIEGELRERVMRNLYEDQRNELYDAIMGLIMADPYDREALREAQEKLLLAANRQKPRSSNERTSPATEGWREN